MNYIDLFSGIGGFALGAYWAGMKFDKHYFSEVDEYATKIYRRRFPDAIPLGDITKIDTEALVNAESERSKRESSELCETNGRQNNGMRWKPVSPSATTWLITGGFPCQDISVAGKGEGIQGSRSGFGLRCGALLGLYNPGSSSLRTSERSLFADLPMCVHRLPKSGTMRSGKIFEQATWVRRTKGSASGLWPTPRGSEKGVGLVGGTGHWQMLQAKTANKKEALEMGAGNGGQLNPMWVEWLMGYPEGWTDLNASVTPLSLK